MIWLIAWRLSRWLPTSVMSAAMDRLVPLALRRGVIPQQHLRRNLTAVLGELEPAALEVLVRRNVRSYARYWVEVFQLSGRRRADVLRQVVVEDPQALRAAASGGAGVVLALPHMGNWDVAGAWAAQYYRVTTVAEQVSPPGLYSRFTRMRESVGMRVVPLVSGAETLTLLCEALEAGGVVALVADRVVSGSAGVPVRFAGGAAMLPAGPATLAYRTGAALLPVSLHYDGPRLCLRFLPQIAVDASQPRRSEVARATQALADAFAAAVARHPQDWRALQPVVGETSPELDASASVTTPVRSADEPASAPALHREGEPS